MADKLLKSIKFPTLPDRYVIGDTSLTEEGAAADAKAVGDALATKADTKGTYEDLIVGGAEQLMSDEYETDKEPYLFRPTGGSADVGNREYLDKIVGGTVGWNQLVPDANIHYTTSEAVVWTDVFGFVFSLASGHKYLISFIGKTVSGGGIGIRDSVNGVVYRPAPLTYQFIYSASTNTNQTTFLQGTWDAGTTDAYLQIHDLTALFNPTIADYIYTLEQSQAGAGVAWFKKLFPKDYYEYNAGELLSVEGLESHDTIGFNQWDEEWEIGGYNSSNGEKVIGTTGIRAKNFIQILPNTNCCFTNKGTDVYVTVCYYDADRIFISGVSGASGGIHNGSVFTTPSSASYMTFAVPSYGTTYNHDICINLSDPSRNGEYEPYQKHTYPLDSSLTLRGIPKLVDGKLAYDGDVYPPSGEVQRRYGLRAYQSGDESLADAITDGTNTVYKLATPTTETADGYEQYQICDPSGTEEFVTTGIVPVGHETRYPHDLKKKIETAPDSPSTDGTYLMKRSGGKNTYMALPSTPSANGAYVLTVTVSGGNATYSWTAKE